MPRLQFEIEAEDRGSAEVDKLSRNVDELERGIDDLSRSQRDQARAADESERSTRGFALAAGGAVATVGALAAGFVALTRQQAEYQRLVERASFVSNRSQRDVEALIRTFEQYGIAIDSTEDALRTFYDRLGDARADPNIESAQIFREIGLEIDRADVRLEDFLERIQALDRQSQIFVIETVIGGEGAAILQAAADANFQGNLEANLTLTLDPEDRQAILEADRQIERATQTLSNSIDRLIASNTDLITGPLNALANSLDNPAGFLFGGAFGIDPISTQPPQRPAPFVPQGPRAPDTGRRLVLEPGAQQAPAGFSDVIGDPTVATARRLTLAERGGPIRVRGTQALGPGLALGDPRRSVQSLGGLSEVGGGGEIQALLGGISNELAGIHFEISEFLPAIADNTLGAVSAAADFALQPNIVSLTRAGVATARLVGELLDIGRPRPVGSTDDQDFAFLGSNDTGEAATVLPTVPLPIETPPDLAAELPIDELSLYNLELEGILELIDPELAERFRNLQTEASDVWRNITSATDNSEVQYEAFRHFMETRFRPQWNEFQVDALDAWEANREGLGLSAAETEALDAFLRGPFISTIDAFEESFIGSWEAIAASETDFEDRTRQIAALVGEEMPLHAALLEAGLTGVWQSALGAVDEFGLAAGKVNAQLGEETPAVVAGITTIDEAFAALAAGVITVGQFAHIVNNQIVDESETVRTEITTIEEAYAALTAGIITAGEFAEIAARLAQGGVDSLGASLRAGAHSAGLLALAVASIPDRTYTVTEVRRTVYETVGEPSRPFDPARDHPAFGLTPNFSRPFDPARDHPAFGLTPNNPQTFHPVGSGRGPFPLGQPRPGAFDPRNHPANRGFQDGGRFLVDRPSFFLAGEAGRELVQITPENAQGAGGAGANVEVHLNIAAVDARSVEELIRGSGREAVVEIIRDATSNGEAVVSTRGLVDDRAF